MTVNIEPVNYIEKQIKATGKIIGLADRFLDIDPKKSREYLQMYYSIYRRILICNGKENIAEFTDEIAKDIESTLSKRLNVRDLN